MVRKSVRDDEHKKIFECAFLHYKRDLSQVEIARKMGIAQSLVSRLLKRAIDENIVNINITMDYHSLEEISNKLKTRFNLRDVRIVWSLKEKFQGGASLAKDIGLEAARYFEEKAKRGSKVGISAGQTMYEFVNALSRPPRRIKLYPLVSWVAQNLLIKRIHASTLVSIWWYKFDNIEAYKLDMPYLASDRSMQAIGDVAHKLVGQIKDINFIITSVGRVDKGSTFAEWVEDVGLNIETLKNAEIVGDFIGHPITKDGKEKIIEGLKDLVYTPLEMRDIRDDIVKKNNPDQFVMLVAGDYRKLDAIRACLEGGLCNVLITDYDVAKELLNS